MTIEELKEIEMVLEEFQIRYDWFPKNESNYIMKQKLMSVIVAKLKIKR